MKTNLKRQCGLNSKILREFNTNFLSYSSSTCCGCDDYCSCTCKEIITTHEISFDGETIQNFIIRLQKEHEEQFIEEINELKTDSELKDIVVGILPYMEEFKIDKTYIKEKEKRLKDKMSKATKEYEKHDYNSLYNCNLILKIILEEEKKFIEYHYPCVNTEEWIKL